jgi:uncharacterized protein YjbJ (UPF0337 family)
MTLGIERRASEFALERPSKRIRELERHPMGELIDKVKGKIKQTAGALTGDKKLEREGQADEAKGAVKGAVEEVKHAVKEAVKK